MARISIELDWPRDPKGYRLAETGYPKELRIARNGKEKSLPSFQPLASTDSLFEIFANIATSPEGALDFVQRYGPLTWDGWDSGDQVYLVTSQAERMREILRAWAGKKKHLRMPRRSPKSFGLPIRVHPEDTGPSSSLEARVVWDPFGKTLKWELRPRTLLDGLWLQLEQALTSGVQIQQCEHCGSWFEAGRGTGRRLDSKFCSDEHRIAFNSLKRSRET